MLLRQRLQRSPRVHALQRLLRGFLGQHGGFLQTHGSFHLLLGLGQRKRLGFFAFQQLVEQMSLNGVAFPGSRHSGLLALQLGNQRERGANTLNDGVALKPVRGFERAAVGSSQLTGNRCSAQTGVLLQKLFQHLFGASVRQLLRDLRPDVLQVLFGTVLALFHQNEMQPKGRGHDLAELSGFKGKRRGFKGRDHLSGLEPAQITTLRC